MTAPKHVAKAINENVLLKQEAARRRDERIRSMLREGLTAPVIRERTGAGKEVIFRIKRELGRG